MAQVTYQNADSDWNNVANWVGGAVPATGDTVYFGSGSQSLTTNMDQTAVNLASIETHPDFSGDIGASGAPLRITCDLVHHSGRGAFYYQDEDNPGGGNTDHTDVIICNAVGSQNAMVISGDQVDIIVVYNGTITNTVTTNRKFITAIDPKKVTSRATITTAGGAGKYIFTHGTITFSSALSAGSEIVMTGGSVSGDTRSVDDLYILGGDFTTHTLAPAVNDAVNDDLIVLSGQLDIRPYPALGYGNAAGNGSNTDTVAMKLAKVIRRQDQTSELTAGGDKYIEVGVLQVGE